MLRFIGILLWAMAVTSQPSAAAKPEYSATGADIFDPHVPAERLITDAVARAKPGNKRVLLFFGANWCPWCRRLSSALTTDRAVQAQLNARFVLVYVDANTRNDRKRNAAVLERYGNPTLRFGLPVFVVLDSEGNHLTTRETASLSADTAAKVADRVLAFLKEWSG